MVKDVTGVKTPKAAKAAVKAIPTTIGIQGGASFAATKTIGSVESLRDLAILLIASSASGRPYGMFLTESGYSSTFDNSFELQFGILPNEHIPCVYVQNRSLIANEKANYEVNSYNGKDYKIVLFSVGEVMEGDFIRIKMAKNSELALNEKGVSLESWVNDPTIEVRPIKKV